MSSGKSINGWAVVYPGGSGLVTKSVPGLDLRLTTHGDASGLLLYIAARVHNEVHSLTANNKRFQDDGGYAFRQARNANSFSNHASGTAIDLNYALWPQNGSHRSLTAAQRKAMLKILADVDEVAFWGGMWQNMTDEMHWEVKPGVTPSQLQAWLKRKGINSNGVISRARALVNRIRGI